MTLKCGVSKQSNTPGQRRGAGARKPPPPLQNWAPAGEAVRAKPFSPRLLHTAFAKFGLALDVVQEFSPCNEVSNHFAQRYILWFPWVS